MLSFQSKCAGVTVNRHKPVIFGMSLGMGLPELGPIATHIYNIWKNIAR